MNKTEFIIKNGVLEKYNEKSTTMIIPDGVVKIGDDVFDDECHVEKIIIPDSLKCISGSDFSSLYYLKEFVVSETHETLCTDEFGVLYNKNKTDIIRYPEGRSTKIYVVPTGVLRVGDCAFSGVVGIGTVKLPYTCYSLGESAFAFSEISSIHLPGSIKLIGEYAFEGCVCLKEITIPKKVKTIRSGTFYECNALEKVTFLGPISKIMDYAFCACESLENIYLPDTIKTLGRSSFEDCFSLTEVRLSDNIKHLPDFAFACCDNLQTVNHPKSLKTMGIFVFENY